MDDSTQRTIQDIQYIFSELEAATQDFVRLKEVCRNFADEVSCLLGTGGTRCVRKTWQLTLGFHVREVVVWLHGTWM